MALPQIGDGEQVGDGNLNETLIVGKSTQPIKVGAATTTTVGFFGATPVARGSFVSTQSINALSVSGVVGFTSSTSLSSLIEKVNSMAALLASLGLTAAS